MTKALSLLATARQALIEGRPEDAHNALTRFQELPSQPNTAEAHKTKRELEQLIDLAEAGRAGVTAARQGLIGAVEIATGGVYL